MDKEQSKKYIEIVKNGNMDDMFDFARQQTLQEITKIVEGMKREIFEVSSEMPDLDKLYFKRYLG